MQDILVADATATAKLTLWQDDIGKLEVNKTYELHNLVIKSFNGNKYLTPPKSGFTIEDKPDISITDFKPNELKPNELHDVEVIGIADAQLYVKCISCKSSVTSIKEKIGKCSVSQRTDKCTKQVSIKLLVASGDEQKHTLLALLPAIRTITGVETLTAESNIEDITTLLLMAEPFNVKFTQKDIINVVYRSTIH